MAAKAAQVVLKQVVQNGQRLYAVESCDGSTTRLVPSVTTVLGSAVNKPGLASWQRKMSVEHFKKRLIEIAPRKANKAYLPSEEDLAALALESIEAPNQERDKAGQFGTTSHAVFETIIKEDMDTFECSCEVTGATQAFLNWRQHVAKQADLRVIQSEVPIFSARYGYAGVMDALATMPRSKSKKRSLVVLDWKTSKSMRVEYAWQVAAYVRAYEELTDQSVDSAFLVRLEKETGDFEVRKIRDIDAAFQGFLACLSVYKAIHEPMSYFT